MKKKVPKLETDKQAEAFLAQDLSDLDFSQFKPARFEFEKKDEQINMRVPRPLLAALKARAKARDIPYTRFIRETLERAMTVNSDLREGILDAIYRADSAVSCLKVIQALRRHGFQQAEATIISNIREAVAGNPNIKMDSRNGEVTYQWVGQRYAARRSLVNHLAREGHKDGT